MSGIKKFNVLWEKEAPEGEWGDYVKTVDHEAEVARLRAEADALREENEFLRQKRRIEQWRSHLPADPGAPGTSEIETKGEHDYNNDVRIYREGIAVMEEVLSKIDGRAVQTTQAVDLGQFREAVLCWRREQWSRTTYVPDAESSPGDNVERADRLLALIDSHLAGGQP